MRDPDRIEPFLDALGELWKRHPDMRFGQLFMNLVRDERGGFHDTWEWEDDRFLARMETFEEDAKAQNDQVMAELEKQLKGLPGGAEILRRLREELDGES